MEKRLVSSAVCIITSCDCICDHLELSSVKASSGRFIEQIKFFLAVVNDFIEGNNLTMLLMIGIAVTESQNGFHPRSVLDIITDLWCRGH